MLGKFALDAPLIDAGWADWVDNYTGREILKKYI